jgi:EAL domain-containing protein (putative c-di-GMP-specific phosphodiesterase class I)
MLVPADFLGVAQESGLIDGIGEWVLRTACAQAKVWESQRVHDPTPRVAVNLSGREFRREGLADMVASCLAEAGLKASLLELEISESAMTWNVERSIGIMRELKELGLQIALDDFGLGHSSLIDLKRFPADALKIDQSFIRDLMKDDGQQAIVEAIIAMARSLGVRTVAEGVETEDQLALLRRRECHAVQGYLYSRPLSAEDLVEFLVRRDASVEQPHVLP